MLSLARNWEVYKPNLQAGKRVNLRGFPYLRRFITTRAGRNVGEVQKKYFFLHQK